MEAFCVVVSLLGIMVGIENILNKNVYLYKNSFAGNYSKEKLTKCVFITNTSNLF